MAKSSSAAFMWNCGRRWSPGTYWAKSRAAVAPPAPTAAAPQNPGLVQTVPGNAPAAPVAPPAPPAAAPQNPGLVMTPVAVPTRASGTLGAGTSSLTITASAPGVDGNRVTVVIDNPSATDPLVVQSYITEGDVANPPHPVLYAVPSGVAAVRASVTITVPLTGVVAADTSWVISGVGHNLGYFLASDGTQSRANSIAAWLATAFGYNFGSLVTATQNANVVTLFCITAGTSGNSVSIQKGSGAGAYVLSAANFTGGVAGTLTTAAQLAAAINELPNACVTATAVPGSGVVGPGTVTLSGGIGISAPPDVRWTHPGPGVPAPAAVTP